MTKRRGKVANRRAPTKRAVRAKQRATCGRKIRHDSKAAAAAAKTAMRRAGRPVGLLEVYRCSVCDGWHLGTKGRR